MLSSAPYLSLHVTTVAGAEDKGRIISKKSTKIKSVKPQPNLWKEKQEIVTKHTPILPIHGQYIQNHILEFWIHQSSANDKGETSRTPANFILPSFARLVWAYEVLQVSTNSKDQSQLFFKIKCGGQVI